MNLEQHEMTVLSEKQRTLLLEIRDSTYFSILATFVGSDSDGKPHVFNKQKCSLWLNEVLNSNKYGTNEDKYWLNGLRNAYIVYLNDNKLVY